MYCMSVASTIAKLPFSILTVTLRYGEDDMSDLYSCISMIGPLAHVLAAALGPEIVLT